MNSSALIRAILPKLEIDTIAPLGEGDFTRAFLINDEEVVRIAKHDLAARALAREACLLAHIASLGLPVPRPRFVSGATSLSHHRMLRGVALDRARWLTFEQPARERSAARIGEFFTALHAVDISRVDACDVATIDHAADLAALRRRLASHVAAPLPTELRAALDRCLAQHDAHAQVWRYSPAILHMDLSPDHVLIDERTGEISGIIDWGDVAIGDPARDFIFLYEDWGDDFLRLALRGYTREGAGRLLPRIYLRYLADQLEWTLRACSDGRTDDIAHGMVALDAAVADFERAATAPLRDDVPPRDTAATQHTSNGGMQS